ncbi:hypothetical protein [Legionella waltersii]|uniref:Thioredoxin domain-containing protein n=1 Tax=Legionella waltersii TaxID=66969 RepID=A0A0W1A0F2_9GAMM|nr:hypothetical protein [Legionella waltersii]KTD74808.1 hypothetical protein Lwal_2849 [Legionella waltersii]SNV00879.1 Uncharacterised protein [Legionella waltersii]
MKQLLRVLLVYVSFISFLFAAESSSIWFTKNKDNKEVSVNVELYISSTCPYCQKADEFFKSIESQNPWMHVTRYFINQQESSLKLFNERLILLDQTDFAVPSIVFCKSRWVGFASAETTGKELLKGIKFCKEQIEKDGKLSSATISTLNRLGNVNVISANMTENPTPAKYILTVALIDAFNPCSLFCLITFFALLFLKGMNKQPMLTGFLFILMIAVVHFLQQKFITGYFIILPWLRIPGAIIGLIGFYSMGHYFRGRSIRRIFLPLSLLIGLMVYIYQQTCVVNWTYVFQQWLSTQDSGQVIKAMYQLVYQLVYVLPLMLIMLLYKLIFSLKIFAKMAKKLDLIGVLVMLAISLLLIIYPYSLSNNALSMFIWVFMVIAGWILSYFYTPTIESE